MKIDFPELSTDLSRVSIPCSVQAKYDGELVVWKNGCLTNRYGRERFNMPCTQGLVKDVELIGELYWDTGKKNFYEAQTHLKNDDTLLKFAVFAFYHADLSYAEQLHLLKLLSNHNELRHIAEGMNAYSHAEVEYFHKEYLKAGYEGTVLKPLPMKSERSWIKWKPSETMDLLVLGVEKGKSAIAVGTPDGKILGHCSTLGREKEIDLLIGKCIVVGETKEDYLLTGEVVVEVKHLGVIAKSGHLRNPRISRFREDKKL
jgi:hypothetical protein